MVEDYNCVSSGGLELIGGILYSLEGWGKLQIPTLGGLRETSW